MNLPVLNNPNTHIETHTRAMAGGMGINFQSKLYNLKPATLTIIQQNSNVEGKKGSLRIVETNDVFPSTDVAFLSEPVFERKCYTGLPGELNKTPENLICMSFDDIRPDPRSRQPQAMFCNSCPQNDWTEWNRYKAENKGATNKNLAPPCQASFKTVLLDTRYKMPLQVYFQGQNKKAFDAYWEKIAWILQQAAQQGKNPNIFDLKFKLSTKQVQNGKYVYYIYEFGEPSVISPDERAEFAVVYEKYMFQLQRRNEEFQAKQNNASNQLNRNSTFDYEEGELVEDDMREMSTEELTV